MATAACAVAGLALPVSGCGSKPLALPADPIDRAATCGVVAAANARQKANSARGALPFEEQGRILHYGMIVASQGGAFQQDKVSAVVKRMPEIEGEITGRDFTTLTAPCAGAFPAAGRTSGISLPSDPFQARLGCYELGSFLNRSLQSQTLAYGNRLSDYGSLRRRLDYAVGASLRQRGATTKAAQDRLRTRALATMVELGSPAAVMDQCLARYPDHGARESG